ncbi:MAG: HlyC/CorC family transporter [Dermatophilaceae bacterium]|jgi:CBS domain containing-hemolysin-like protein|nr:HlyC/CorC family transporter [Dermatophilaceae bacterium]HOF35602.1 hemolysin family protein [Dermatophilaceae bacterium]HPK88197.1 hemolysin family protein [Dermatophilaceae bacterium]HQG10177.1 hemolysin family protein [Dermatophilaceae bacterium]
MSHSMALWISLGLLLANAFFVGAEFAAMAARRSALEPLAAARSARAATCLAALEQMGSMLATAQLGITVCSVGLGALAEAALHEVLHPVFAALPLGEAWANGLSFAGALLIVVYLHVVAGEMIPKNLALAGPERAALVLVPALLMVSRVLRPVVAVMEWVAKGLVRAIFRIEPKDEIASAFTVEEVTHILAESEREGLIEEHREGLVRSALEFSAKLAADVAVPVDRLVTVAKGVTPEDVERLVARTGFSRYPFLDKEGHVAGYLHLKDILYAADAAARTERVPRKRLRRLATVAPTEEIEDVLATMRGNGTHLARVVDPTGEVIGVIFLEDIVEELVGTISDAETR